MGEFVYGEDWDLDSVVRGYMSQAASSATCDIMEWFDSFVDDNPLMRSNTIWDQGFPLDDFPSFSEATSSKVLDEFKGLYESVEMLPASPNSIVVGSLGNKVETSEGAEKLEHGSGSSAAAAPVDVDGFVHATAKYKRRKNHQKQVVQHVTADGISSDLWAWRKYGQKPIKGSPYPRSYYRCSSLKGCVARKQVERSSSEPGMFIVTYTGEHSHTRPTRRSALAGITRPSKFSAPKKPSADATKYEIPQSMPKSTEEIVSINNHEGSSPISTSTMDDGPGKLETFVWGDSGNFNKILNPPSLVLGEEIFLGFDELEGLGMDFALTGC